MVSGMGSGTRNRHSRTRNRSSGLDMVLQVDKTLLLPTFSILPAFYLPTTTAAPINPYYSNYLPLLLSLANPYYATYLPFLQVT